MLGLAVPSCWPLALVGLTLFLALLWSGRIGMKAGAFYGLVFGTMSAGGGALWMLEAYPIARLGVVSPVLGLALVGGTWFLTALALGSGIALGAPLIMRAKRSPCPPLIAALLWPVMEQAGMWANAVYTWAPHSYFGPHFSPGAFGYALAEQPYVLQLAHPLGVFALSFVAALIAGVVAFLPQLKDGRMRGRALTGVAALACLLLVPALLPYRAQAPSSSLTFALIAADNGADDVRTVASSTRALLGQAAAAHPDAVAFPEGYGLGVAYPDRTEREREVKRLFPTDTLILDWTYYRTEAAYDRNAPGADLLEYISTAHGLIGAYQKVYLMPVGEYEPVVYTTLYGLFDSPGFHSYLSYLDNAIAPGTHAVAAHYRNGIVGGLLCSDLLDPYLYRQLGGEHADVLVNLGNQNWFHHSHALYGKTLQVARVAAVENRRPFVMANDGAPSFALDAKGTLIAESSWNAPGVLVVSIPYP